MDNGVPPTDKRTPPRPASRAKKSTRSAAPGDPRTEGANGSGSPPGNGATAGNGNGANDAGAGAAQRGGRSAAVGGGDRTASKTPRQRSGATTATRAHHAPSAPSAPTVVASPVAAELPTTVGEASPLSTTSLPPILEAPSGVAAAEAVPLPEAPLDLFADPFGFDGVLAEQARMPLLLPPIVPGEPDTPAAPALPAAAIVVPAAMPEFTDTDGTDGMPSLARPKKPMRPLRKPITVQRRRPRVRRVTRVVRHVDTWSVFKVALVFNLFLYGVCLTAGVLLWQVAQNTGTVDNIQRFFESFGWETFQLKGGEIFHNAWIAGLFLVVGYTGLAVLMATLFNLITDLVGGIRVSVLEEEVVAREERGLGWRRAGRSRSAASDESEPG